LQDARFLDLAAAFANIQLFWDVTLCRPVNSGQRLEPVKMA